MEPPGRNRQKKETQEETLIRECREEIACDVKPTTLIFEKTEFDHLGKPTHQRYVYRIEFLSDIIEGPEVRFFPASAVPNNLRKRHKQIVNLVRRRNLKNRKRKILRQNKNQTPVEGSFLYSSLRCRTPK